MRSGSAQNESAPTPPRRQYDACGPEDHNGKPPRSCTNGSDNRSTSATAFEHHSSRLGAPHPQPIKISDLNGLAKFPGQPFRLAKLTACRKCAYLSALSQGVKAESADFIGVLAIPYRSGCFVNARVLREHGASYRQATPAAGQPEVSRVMRKSKVNVLR